MTNATIILIGGLSSSGKTSIARALQKLFAEQSIPYLHMPIDAFMQFLPEQWFCMNAGAQINRQESGVTFIDQSDANGPKTKIQVGPVAMQLLTCYFPTLKLLASHGNNIISDAVFNSDFLKYGMQELKGLRVFSIGIRCPLEITTQRESKRGAHNGGYSGLSRWYAEESDANTHELCDLIIDSSNTTPEHAAQKIFDFIESNEPSIFEQYQQ